MRRTEREQNIEQVAGLIYQQFLVDPDLTLDQAQKWNRYPGWTFEVRYDSREYLNDADYTRVESEKLSGNDLYAAWVEAYKLANPNTITPAR